MTEAELLAILCRTGPKGMNAVELGRHLLEEFQGLHGLLRADVGALFEVKGLGKAKVAQIKAALELGRRAMSASQGAERARVRIRASRDAASRLRPRMTGLPAEIFRILFLNGRSEVIAEETISEGTPTESAVYPRKVLHIANRYHATAFLCAHNHPSGGTRPSATDRTITRELVFAGEVMGVPLLDHLIIGEGERYYSFADAGLIGEYRQAFAHRHAR